MSTTVWTGSNGNWTDPTWSDGVPDAALDAIIAGTSSSPDTVTFDTASGAAHSLTMTFATLAVAGGTLTLETSSVLDSVDQTSGLLDFAAGGTISGPVVQTAGAIEIDSGTLLLQSADNRLNGTLSGNGELEIAAGATVDTTHLTTEGGLTIEDAGKMGLSAGTISGTGTLAIAAAGTFVGDGTLEESAIKNSGKLIAASGGTLTLDGPVTGSGTLIAYGALDFEGVGSVITSKIIGPSLIEFSGGSTTIDPGTSGVNVKDVELTGSATLTMGLSVAYNGVFTDDASATGTVFDLADHKVDFRHASFTGSSGSSALIDGGGALINTGTMTLNGAALDGGTGLSNSKLVTQTGSVALGAPSGGNGSIVNQAGATYDIAGAVSLSAASATTDTIENAGLFAKTGSGTAVIGAAFTNIGTIEVTSGTLEITAAFTNTGTIIGTQMQSNGTTFITAPSASVFNQYATAMDPVGGTGALTTSLPNHLSAPMLAAPHSG